MNKIMLLKSGEEQLYRIKIYSDELRNLTMACPDDGQLMMATGLMYLGNQTSRWSVEYKCTKDEETYCISTRDQEMLTKRIAGDVLRTENGSQE